MFKKVISVFVAMLICCSFVSVFADNVFEDVTEENYPWAVKEIEEMAGMGIIKGYSEKTFGPADNITKVQALLLCSRILGYSDENNNLFIEKALEVYGNDLKELYSTEYIGEVAYLLYKGVLTARELPAYIGEDNAALPLKRYEAAVLMVKAMDAVEKAEGMTGSSVFTDADEIPATAKPYVNYVNAIELMIGMNKTAEVNEFAPMVNVNRAQMAVLLYRMMNRMKSETEFGVVDSVNVLNEVITYTPEVGAAKKLDYFNLKNAKVLVDGYASDFDKIEAQAVLAITKRDGEVYSVEAINVEGDETVVGVVTNVSTSSSNSTIRIRPVDENADAIYDVAENVSVTIDGSPSVLRLVKTGMYVKAELKGGKVILIDAEQKSKSISGTVREILLSPVTGLAIETTADGIVDYTFASGVEVIRNGKAAEASAILVGDRVSVTLLYGQISKVTASSTNYNTTGTIEKILIATLPQLTIVNNGVTETLSISRDAKYEIEGVDGTIYDLRLGASVTLSVQGETVVKVSATAPTTSSVIAGTIETINTEYGFMLVNSKKADGSVEQTQVFLRNTRLTVVDSKTGATQKASYLKKGMEVSVTGAMNMGAFEATAVIITAQ